jgi:hypothetical protein
MTPEGRVKHALKKRLDQLGTYHFWPVQTGFGSFTVDCLACHKGHFAGIEVKAPGKKPTLRQQLVMSAMLASGGQVYVVDSVETARDFAFDVSQQAQ